MNLAKRIANGVGPGRPREADTGITCGHPDRPYFAKGMCRPCYTSNYTSHRIDLAVAKRGGQRKRKRGSGGCDHPDQQTNGMCTNCYRNYIFKKKYGVTLEHVKHMLEEQNFECAINGCDHKLSLEGDGRVGTGFAIDHSHITVRVRGVLCSSCNKALGYLRDSVARARGIVQFLELHEQGDLKI